MCGIFGIIGPGFDDPRREHQARLLHHRGPDGFGAYEDAKHAVYLAHCRLAIIDLSARLGMRPTEPSPRHVIIVAQVNRKVVGLLVEAVSDILTVTDDNIQPTPEISSDLEKQFARGILAIDKRMICLVELEGLFPDESEAA